MADKKKEKDAEKPAKKEKDPAAAAAKAQKAADGKSAKKKKGESSDFQIAEAGATRVSPSYKPNLKKIYDEVIVAALQKEFNFKSPMQVPRLNKVVLNCCMKESVGNPKVLDGVVSDLAQISGQKVVVTRARKAIATFKIRKGLSIGARVTLRRARMYEFLDLLVNVALPRVRDFKGVSAKSFDGRGNYSMGIREHIIFPQINYDKVERIFGFTVTVETTAKTNEHARSLLTHFGMPFRK